MKPTGLPKKKRPSNIVNVTHDALSKDLHVTFRNGQTYIYHGVEPQSYLELMKAPSLGQHFHAHIKDKHIFRKLKK